MKNQPFIEASCNFRFRNTPETLRYFYHPDHIGSTSWVTDSAKNGIQYCEYLPFGEPFLDQRSTTWNSRYTFSGKERDNETGYSLVKKLRFFSSLAFGNEKQVFHYAHCLRRFGARYYNSDISIWLSVDPMADKYPNLTPYAYCANNPIVLVDPDGRAPWDPTNVKQARQYAKISGGYLRIRKTPNGKEATVTTNYVFQGWHGAEIRLFNPTNDSWGQKIGNFFRKIGNAMTGGQYGTADNGQGQETRKGDGGNKQVDVFELISNMPEPFENGRKRETSNTSNSADFPKSEPKLIQDGTVFKYTIKSTGAKKDIILRDSEDSAALRKWWGIGPNSWVKIDTSYPNIVIDKK